MTTPSSNALDDRLYVLRSRWEQYTQNGQFELFVEFAVAVNSLAEHFNRLKLPGMVRLCEGLENVVMTHLGDPDAHPIPQQDIVALQRQLDTLLAAVKASRTPAPERRTESRGGNASEPDWIKPRIVWVVCDQARRELGEGLTSQLRFFGFQVIEIDWSAPLPDTGAPLALILVPSRGRDDGGKLEELAYIEKLRAHCRASQVFYLGAQPTIEPIVELMRAGVDVAIPETEQASSVLNRILDLVQNQTQEKYRVLVVEDSRVAAVLIQRTLAEHGIDSRAIQDPGEMLEVLAAYRPDLILMDMHMPRFSGIEATRVLRQMSAYQSIPLVYLSGESDIGLQIEALRLGGDQFLAKPFNPVLLAAVVKTKIERFRETQRSSTLDGLTGLLNHTATKARLKAMIETASPTDHICAAMIDIDHFKAVNDTYGHPVGDQVIRGLAWLLKGRLRATDLIGRYGGEEFLIALPNATPERAAAVIERIRRDFAALPHAHPDGTLYATFSAGMAVYPVADSAASLTEEADGALLQAKRLGRNRIVLGGRTWGEGR